MSFLLIALLLILFVVTMASCVSDFRSLRIPNSHSLAVIGLFIPAYLFAPDSFGLWWYPFLAAGLMFFISYVMFCYGLMGGGDSKLATALALWVGLKGLMIYVFWMAVAGGVIAAFGLWLKAKKPFKNPTEGSWIAQAQGGRNAVPYGIAITVGAWAAIFHTESFSKQIHQLIKIIHS